MTPMRKRPLKGLLCALLILISLLSLDAYAHPGRTDANGGHYNRSDGTYHYHNGEYAGRPQSNTPTVPAAPANKTITQKQGDAIVKQEQEKQKLYQLSDLVILVLSLGAYYVYFCCFVATPLLYAILEILIKPICYLLKVDYQLFEKYTKNTIAKFVMANIVLYILYAAYT